MARQQLGAKKHALCEAAAGRTYLSCLTRGGGGHFWALCWWPIPEGQRGSSNADWVNYKTGEVVPYFRDGARVEAEA